MTTVIAAGAVTVVVIVKMIIGVVEVEVVVMTTGAVIKVIERKDHRQDRGRDQGLDLDPVAILEGEGEGPDLGPDLDHMMILEEVVEDQNLPGIQIKKDPMKILKKRRK